MDRESKDTPSPGARLPPEPRRRAVDPRQARVLAVEPYPHVPAPGHARSSVVEPSTTSAVSEFGHAARRVDSGDDAMCRSRRRGPEDKAAATSWARRPRVPVAATPPMTAATAPSRCHRTCCSPSELALDLRLDQDIGTAIIEHHATPAQGGRGGPRGCDPASMQAAEQRFLHGRLRPVVDARTRRREDAERDLPEDRGHGREDAGCCVGGRPRSVAGRTGRCPPRRRRPAPCQTGVLAQPADLVTHGPPQLSIAVVASRWTLVSPMVASGTLRPRAGVSVDPQSIRPGSTAAYRIRTGVFG